MFFFYQVNGKSSVVRTSKLDCDENTRVTSLATDTKIQRKDDIKRSISFPIMTRPNHPFGITDVSKNTIQNLALNIIY